MSVASADTEIDESSDIRVDFVDVGHGSCVSIVDGENVTLVDTGPGAAVLEYLRSENITHIDTVILSHADKDHIGGLVALLGAGFSVGRIIWSSDADKASNLWMALTYSLDDLDRRGLVVAVEEAKEGVAFEVGQDIRVEVLAPRLRLLRRGAGAADLEGRQISSNSVSAVVLVHVRDSPTILLPGDLDATGYAHLADAGHNLQAPYLVLPHHGGLMGTTAQTTGVLRELVSAVRPSRIFVSNGRGKYDNPREAVIVAARSAAPEAKVACAQLSERCAAVVAQGAQAIPFAAGAAKGACCAGTIRLTQSDGLAAPKDMSVHEAFITANAPTALCRRALPEDEAATEGIPAHLPR